jgi:predicted nucleic acid-binding protein
LAAYDAAYVALADGEQLRLVTDDDGIVAAAPDMAVALADV